LGDFNGDGYADLFWYHAQEDYLDFFFGSSVPDTVPDWTVHSQPWGSQHVCPRSIGDLNGDGYCDFVNVWGTLVYLGGAEPDTVPDYLWPNVTSWPIGVVRSLNGDGADDLLHADRHLYLGGQPMDDQADGLFSFPCTLADAAISGGDFNHDGYNDLVLLAADNSEAGAGVLTLYLGHPWMNPVPAFTVPGGSWGLAVIQKAASLGDVNGDSIDDLAIGGYHFLFYAGLRGKCVIIAGDSSLRVDADPSFIPHPSSFSLSAFPNPFNPTTTLSLSVPRESEVIATLFDITGRKIETLLHTAYLRALTSSPSMATPYPAASTSPASNPPPKPAPKNSSC
jgi:hypothetical protein